MTQIAIIGAGITGLSLAWSIKKRNPLTEITLFEEGKTPGGMIGSVKEPYFFEKGPRTFSRPRSQALLKLIDELGLSDQVIDSETSAKKYVYLEGKLRPFLRPGPLLTALAKDLTTPASSPSDESVADFSRRRFGRSFTRTCTDPMIQGIFAGDIEQLSLEACFSRLSFYEKEYRSVLRGMRKHAPSGKKGLFTLKNGLQTLTQALAENFQILYTSPSDLSAFDKVFVTSSLSKARSLFPHLPPYQELIYASMVSINCGYQKQPFKQKGFGYLIPTCEKEPILGTVFDSSIFPQQSRSPEELRLTLMAGGIHHPEMVLSPKEALEDLAIGALRRHLQLPAPDFLQIHRYPEAIPQYPVHHNFFITKWLEEANRLYPHVHFVSNFIKNPSVNGRIEAAIEASLAL